LHAQVNVQVSAPPTVLPGQAINYGVKFTSVGRGPALEAIWTNHDPAGTEVGTNVGALLVGEQHDFVTTFTVPANACPMVLVDTALIEYQDIAGEVSTVSGTALTTVLDIVPPVITLTGPAAMVLECGVSTYTEAGATAHDTCDPDVPVTIGGATVDPS